jgi:hypothetical protein
VPGVILALLRPDLRVELVDSVAKKARAVGEIIRATLICATIWLEGISKSAIMRGGTAPPQGLIRPARSSMATLRPARARSSAAVAPEGPPPTTTTS